jgi:ATP-binding cassette subfamily F protein 3
MEALSTKTLELAPAGPGDGAAQSLARLFYGNYAYYLDRMEREAAAGVGGKEAGGGAAAFLGGAAGGSNTAANTPPDGALPLPDGAAAPGRLAPHILIKAAAKAPLANAAGRREAAKQQQTLIRRLERQEAEILKTLEDWEAEKARLELEISRPEVYSSGEKAKQVQEKLNMVSGSIATKTVEWEAKAGELEKARQEAE